jgi:hypothetical protein
MKKRCPQIALAVLAFLATAVVCAGSAGAEAALEYRVKAAFLYNFAKFVTWPGAAFPDPTASVVFCLVGEDPFGELLESTTKDRKVEGRSIEIRRLALDASLAGCHLVFVSGVDSARSARVLQQATAARALAIGESEDFLTRGGMIRLLVEDGKVRFDVSTKATDTVGLKVSSQLLKLARGVER